MFDKKLLESAELYDKRYKNFATLTIFPVLILFIGLLVFAVFAKKQLTVTSVGTIEPSKIIAQIQSTSSAPIVQNNLLEGKEIKKNTLLVKYNSASNATQLESLTSQFNQATDQKKALTSLQDSLMSGQDKFSKPDDYGFYQTFQNYQAQVQSLTDSVNKNNQSVNDANTATNNESSTINSQIAALNQEIANYTELENAATNGSSVSQSNPYLSQYNAYLDERNSAQKATSGASQASIDSQLASLKSQFLSTVNSAISSLQSQVQSLSIQGSGLTPNNSYDTSLNSQLLSLKAQALATADQQMTSLNNNLSDLKAKIALQKQTDQYSEILASNSGILHVLPNVLGLKTISAGTPIAEIYPNLTATTTIYLTTYISSSDISGIKKGQNLRFTVEQNLPQAEILTGKISHIDSAPTTLDNMNVYKVEAKTTLKQSQLSSLRYGLQGKVTVIIGEKTFFNYYKDKVMGKD